MLLHLHHEQDARLIPLVSAGFKLDTLLKLADVKGTDRKTSLLHFVLDQLLKESPAMLSLPHQLFDVKAAASLQANFSLACHACTVSMRRSIKYVLDTFSFAC